MARFLLKLIGRYSFVVTLLILCFLCFALAEAKADTLGLPFNPQFSRATYPYARVLTGCTDWRRPSQYGDSWGPVSFAGACQNHDMCFHTAPAQIERQNRLGTGQLAGAVAVAVSWGDCNRQYLLDLRQSCDRDLKKARLERGQLGEPDATAQQLCYEIANLYFERAQAPMAVKRFEIAQKMAESYHSYVRGVVFREMARGKGHPPSKEAVEAALVALDNGQDIEMISSSSSTERATSTANREAKSMPVLERDMVTPDPGHRSVLSLATFNP